MLITHKNVYEIQSFTTKFSKIFWAKKKKSRLGWRLGENRVVLNNSV